MYQKIHTLFETEFSGEPVIKISDVAGGSINRAVCVKTTSGTYFVKWNSRSKYPGMLQAEAYGLELLRKNTELFIPAIIGYYERSDDAFLVMEFVVSGKMENTFWNDFGAGLAGLHRNSHETFGLEQDNYIGSLSQSNKKQATWKEFFINERLLPQIRLARENQRLTSQIAKTFDRLFLRLETIFPDEKPALLHGDLWNGNYLIGPHGGPALIDPAVYFGHREMDLAMTKLFGGFSIEFYHSYNDMYPLEKEWEERVDVCNLYPLLVHVNLFGGGYALQISDILRRF